LKKDIQEYLQKYEKLSFLNHYTPFYIKKYLDYYRVNIFKYYYNYISQNKWSLTSKETDITHILYLKNETLYCSCQEFLIGMFLCKHVIISCKLRNYKLDIQNDVTFRFLKNNNSFNFEDENNLIKFVK
jgi:hypothetical protein